MGVIISKPLISFTKVNVHEVISCLSNILPKQKPLHQ